MQPTLNLYNFTIQRSTAGNLNCKKSIQLLNVRAKSWTVIFQIVMRCSLLWCWKFSRVDIPVGGGPGGGGVTEGGGWAKGAPGEAALPGLKICTGGCWPWEPNCPGGVSCDGPVLEDCGWYIDTGGWWDHEDWVGAGTAGSCEGTL